MKKNQVKQQIRSLFATVEGNALAEIEGIDGSFSNVSLFDEPLVGFGSADDPLFEAYKQPGVVGPWHLSPREWLPEARSVVSIFFPMSDAVRESNRRREGRASTLWAYARIEGQSYIASFMGALEAWFRAEGAAACAPSLDERQRMIVGGKGIEGFAELDDRSYGSRWSERHAAYACGLGTFGLSRGLITERGMAGRFGSVVVGEAFPVDVRPYSGIDEYCIMCGACIDRCPVGAISLEHGKDHALCAPFIEASKIVHRPRYGCGLCQTGVPCEQRNPSARCDRSPSVAS